MPGKKFSWSIVLTAAVSIAGGCSGRAAADFIPADPSQLPATLPAFFQSFQTFIGDFARWDAANGDLPALLLMLTPQEKRPAMAFLLWDFWLHDHLKMTTGSINPSNTAGLPDGTQPVVSSVPGTGNGGGTVASLPGVPGAPGSGGSGGIASQNTPEASSLALLVCGSLCLLGYRLLRARTAWGIKHLLATQAGV